MTGLVNYREPPVPAFLFDLDGTLIDSVCQNVIAWRNALATVDPAEPLARADEFGVRG